MSRFETTRKVKTDQSVSRFAGRLTENRSPQLEYSIVARATPVTLSFSKLFDCLTDTVPAQFVVEGALNLEQAQRVKLDVLYKDITDGYSDDEGSASTPKKAHYTLESTLLTLHPNQ